MLVLFCFGVLAPFGKSLVAGYAYASSPVRARKKFSILRSIVTLFPLIRRDDYGAAPSSVCRRWLCGRPQQFFAPSCKAARGGPVCFLCVGIFFRWDPPLCVCRVPSR